MGKTPDELAGLEDGQIDWLYYGIADRYNREAAALRAGQGDNVVYDANAPK